MLLLVLKVVVVVLFMSRVGVLPFGGGGGPPGDPPGFGGGGLFDIVSIRLIGYYAEHASSREFANQKFFLVALWNTGC